MKQKSKKNQIIIIVFGSLLVIYLSVFFIRPFLNRHIKRSGPGIKISSIPVDFRLWDAKWSPDGTKIAFYAEKREFPRESSINIYDVLSGKTEQIPTIANNFSKSIDFNLEKMDWSPDGTHLFISGRFSDQATSSKIWAIDLASYEMVLFNQGESFAWSPSGDQVAIIDTELDNSQIRLVDMQSKEERIIYEFDHIGAFHLDVEWSPYDDILAIQVPGKNAEINIYLFAINGVQFTPFIVDSSWQLVSHAWYPGSQWLAFVASYRGQGTVMFAPVNGECMYTWLPQIKNVDNVDITTDGRTALVISQGDLYIVDLEIAARPPIRDGQPKCP